MGAIITLTTDFGLADGYVAAMKGVVLGINPEAKLIDISHFIQPQNVAQAAFVLSTACESFPRGTIHLVVVDPGVGTERRAIILKTPVYIFVGPDNGVFSYLIRRFTDESGDSGQDQRELGPWLEAVEITNPRFWESPVSPTFHGRDIFAPVAAHLSLGVPPEDFGEAIETITVIPGLQSNRTQNGDTIGRIIHIDYFGNLITSIRNSDLPKETKGINIEAGNHVISGLSLTYGSAVGLLALIGSSGYLEISLRDGNAAAYLGVKPGDEIKIRNL
jgi:S-adenosylmethionine hydrolase